MVWSQNSSGTATMEEAFDYYRLKRQIDVDVDSSDWWVVKTPLRRARIVWKLLHNRVQTDDIVLFCGISSASYCNLCDTPRWCESQQHLFIEYSYAPALWYRISAVFCVYLKTTFISELFVIFCLYNNISQIKQLLWVAVVTPVWLMWAIRNTFRFDHEITPIK